MKITEILSQKAIAEPPTLRQAIRVYRAWHGLTAAGLAEKAGVPDAATVSRIGSAHECPGPRAKVAELIGWPDD